jgi:hypothetical protein
VSNRTRSKVDYTEQHISSITRSEMDNVNVNKLSVQNLFFLLHDVLDSGEDIPTGYQINPYHMVFDVKYDLRHKAKLVAGGN